MHDPQEWDMFVEARSQTDIDDARRKITALIMRMSKHVAQPVAIQRFNEAYAARTLPPDVMAAAVLVFDETRGGPRQRISMRTFQTWKKRYFGNPPAKS